MTIQHLYPTTRPSLDLNFARQKRLDPRVTFTRGSTATYVGSDGLIKTAASNEARFDHDPDTGESLGLLVEESRTNLQYPSIPTVSSSAVTVTANAAVAPDGTSTATFCEPNNIGSGVRSNPATISKSVGQFYIHTFFFKPSGYNVAGIDYGSGNPDAYAEAWINVTTNQSYVDNTFNSITSTPLSNGWYKITAVQEIASAGNTPNWGKALSCRPDIPTGGNQSYTRVSGSGGFFWGHQEELGSFPTSYIPTTSSTVTRSADVASMTGTNFSSWYNQSEGTFLMVESASQVTVGNNHRFEIYRNGAANTDAIVHVLNTNNNQSRLVGRSSGSNTTLDISVNNTWSTTRGSRAIALQQDNSAVVRGSSSTISTTCVFPQNLDAFGFGSPANTFQSNSVGMNTLARLTYYPTRLTDTQLQALTL